MSNKVKSIVVAALVLVALVGGVSIYQNLGGNNLDKEVNVVIKDSKGKTLFKEDVGTNAKKLSTLLKEMKKDKKIKLEYEEFSGGLMITGMGVDTILRSELEKNTYWFYTSDNNKSCLESVYCEGADTLNIDDKDRFVFSLDEVK